MSVQKARDMLVPVAGAFDIARTERVFVHPSVLVTPNYKMWLDVRRGRDVSVEQRSLEVISSEGAGKHAVQAYLEMSLELVENLIKAGVPEKLAFKLLPQELYEKL